jgi:type IV secretory pathway TraG/TraD family ATPase VirD4
MLTKLNNFTRGGQMTMHFIRMIGQASKASIKFTIILSVVVYILFFMFFSSPYERYLAKECLIARLQVYFNKDHNYRLIAIETPAGRVGMITAGKFINHDGTLFAVRMVKKAAWQAFGATIISSILILWLVIKIFIARSKKLSNTLAIRGAILVEDQELKKLIKKQNMHSDLTLAGVPLVNRSETQHILFTGTTGVGKSVALTELMDQVRDKNQKAIVYDSDGSFIATYYRPGKDLILNPLDQRSPYWNIWQECRDFADFEAFAESLMPMNLSNSDPFWIKGARLILSAAAFSMRNQNPTTKKLLTLLLTENLENINQQLKNTVAATLVSDKIEKTALSVKATLATYGKSLAYLPDETKFIGYDLGLMSELLIKDGVKTPEINKVYLEHTNNQLKYMVLSPNQEIIEGELNKMELNITITGELTKKFLDHKKKELLKVMAKRGHANAAELFSIRDWVRDDQNTGWLFISTNKEKAAAICPLLSAWLDLAVRSILSLKKKVNRRLWFFMDELPSLYELPSLKEVLAEGRKYGACFVATIQDIHQLRTIYGREAAEALLSFFNTKVCFRTESTESAIWAERAIGYQEIIEIREGFSYGANDIRDGVSLNQERRKTPVVMDTEFMKLNDLEAYLKLPGNFPITKLKFEPTERSDIVDPLIEREIQDMLIEVDNLEKNDRIKDSADDRISNKQNQNRQNKKNFKNRAGEISIQEV